jgi:hypothetical protein
MIQFLRNTGLAGLMVAASGCGAAPSTPPSDTAPASPPGASATPSPTGGSARTPATQPLSKTKLID